MNYSLMYAKKGLYSLWLDHTGHKYVVSDFDHKKAENCERACAFRKEYDRYEDAEELFQLLCKMHGMEPQVVEHDPWEMPVFD